MTGPALTCTEPARRSHARTQSGWTRRRRQILICESDDPTEQFKLPADDRLRAALRREAAPPEQPPLDIEVTDMLSPKEIQARIRAGASVEQVATASGSDIARIRRFAHPVLLERSRAAELATAAHPLLADGPAVLTLLETVSAALVATRPQPGQTQLGRLAQRGQPLDGAAWVAGRPFRQRRAFLLRARRPRRNGHRDRRLKTTKKPPRKSSKPARFPARLKRWKKLTKLTSPSLLLLMMSPILLPA